MSRHRSRPAPGRHRRRALAFVGCVLVAIAGGCSSGGSSKATATSGGSTNAAAGGAGTIEGRLAVRGSKLEVAPHTGAKQEFAITAQTEPGAGELQAIAASGESARVSFRDGNALVVTRTSDALKQLRKVTGVVTAASPAKRTLSIRQDDGTVVRFTVDPADAGAMELAHLRDDHMPAGSRVTVYYESIGARYHARGVEDA